MIDTLLDNQDRFVAPSFYNDLALKPQCYFVLTIHRPANVDTPNNLTNLLDEITKSARGLNIIFPVHPRTRKVLDQINHSFNNLYLCDPLSYLEFNYLVKHAKAVITDSGGITEETTVMGVPCITLRDNTERPETCTIGTNELIGTNPNAIGPAMDKLFTGNWKKGQIPPLWDGKAAVRIIDALLQLG
jgi:UDP-N-acetylglucosamine 2-epimerase (non-hydrolysing)